MKFVKYHKGKEMPYTFASDKDRKTYIDVCEIIWGAVPCDVNWATGTDIYKRALENRHNNARINSK